MKRINATLPALGMVSIDFHKESELVLELYDSQEMARLRSVPHLGVASAVFTGANHSRLEYALLQCAVISLVAKLHRQNAQFALSNTVSLPGLTEEISSGEELLKTWALLGNYGHMQYTYGVEKGLLQAAYVSQDLRAWLVNCSNDTGLKKWSKAVIDNYEDEKFHYICAFLRISKACRGNRRRKLFTHYLRSLVLPPTQIFPSGSSQRDKLARLQQLFSRIRLLTIVAIDSHYSHAPVSLNLSSAILGLANFSPSPQGNGAGFDAVITHTAGLLADELYLHPASAACQREYEIRVNQSIKRRMRNIWSESRASRVFDDLAIKGVGDPVAGKLLPLVRLTFRRARRQLLGTSENLFDSVCQLEAELTKDSRMRVAIDRNPFTGATHVDVLYYSKKVRLIEIALTYSRFGSWLLRTLEADALKTVRNLYPAGSRSAKNALYPRARRRYVERRFKEHAHLMQTLFLSFINFFLPPGYKVVWPDIFSGSSRSANVFYRIRDSEQNLYDEIDPELQTHLVENPRNFSHERLSEIECLQKVVAASASNFVLACMERFQICDESGRSLDDWDGTSIEFFEDKILLKIIEVKTGGTSAQRERDALRQLKTTRTLMMQKYSLNYRTRRIKGKGALLEFFVPSMEGGE